MRVWLQLSWKPLPMKARRVHGGAATNAPPSPRCPWLPCLPCRPQPHNLPYCPTHRPCSWRGRRASCRRRRVCGTQRACTARRWPAWRGTPGAGSLGCGTTAGASAPGACRAWCCSRPCCMPSSCRRLCRHPSAAFKYVRDVLADTAALQPAQQREAFAAAVLGQAPQLLSLDAPAAAQVRPAGAGGYRCCLDSSTLTASSNQLRIPRWFGALSASPAPPQPARTAPTRHSSCWTASPSSSRRCWRSWPRTRSSSLPF